MVMHLPFINLKSRACLWNMWWVHMCAMNLTGGRDACWRSPYNTHHHPIPLMTISNHSNSTAVCLSLQYPDDPCPSLTLTERWLSSMAGGNMLQRMPTRQWSNNTRYSCRKIWRCSSASLWGGGVRWMHLGEGVWEYLYLRVQVMESNARSKAQRSCQWEKVGPMKAGLYS